MPTSLILRETSGLGATVKGAPLINSEVDNNFLSLNINKLEKSSNLGDLTNVPTARNNLGLGTLATQDEDDLSISGGTINNTTIGNTTPAEGTFTDLTVNGKFRVTDDTQSTSTTTGAVVIAGGLGLGKNLNVGGTGTFGESLSVNDITQSTSTTTGSIVTAGGLGVAKNGYFGGNLNVSGDTNIAGDTTMTGVLNLNGNDLIGPELELISTNNDANIKLTPEGTGYVHVSNKRIRFLDNPIASTDAATKQYVDQVAQGLNVVPSASAATTGNLTATYDNGPANDGVGATLTGTGAFPTIDGVTVSVGEGVLVKDQTNAEENGRYDLIQDNPWVLQRPEYADESPEIPGEFIFISEGSAYADTGWVSTVSDVDTFSIGTDPITFIQFSGAGTYTAGAGLAITGTTFDVVPGDGISIDSDTVRIDPSAAGPGLSYTNGVFEVQLKVYDVNGTQLYP